jgi:glucose/arabinose dehydrogenase
MDSTEDLIIRLTTERGADKSISPSDVAQLLGEPWQRHLTPVRQAAVKLAREGRIQVLRKGKPVEDLDAVRGVIRLRIAPETADGDDSIATE